MRSDYEHSNRHKYYLKCHLIFCIKYRKKLLVGKFNDTIKCILKGIAEKSDFDIEIKTRISIDPSLNIRIYKSIAR